MVFMIEVWPCTSRRVGMSFSPRGKRCAPGGGLDGVRTPSSKARKCPACGRAMKKNGRTGKGTQRWRCRACRLSSTMPQRGRRRARTLEEFLSWLPGPSSQTASESTGDAHALRKRIAWCWSIRPRIAPPDAKRHTVMADGTYMGHGWRLIIAIDGESGEVLAFQWRAYEELRRCCRRLEKLFRAGDSSPFPGRRLPQVGRWRAPRTGWRAASTRSSRTCCATRGLPEEHMLRACEWVCYMKTAHPRPESFIPDDPLEDGKATSPEPEGDASPAYGIGIDWNEFHTGTRYPNGTD